MSAPKTFPGALANLWCDGPKSDDDQRKGNADHRTRLHQDVRCRNNVAWGGAYHIKESVGEVIVCKKGEEVHRDEDTKRNGPSGHLVIFGAV